MTTDSASPPPANAPESPSLPRWRPLQTWALVSALVWLLAATWAFNAVIERDVKLAEQPLIEGAEREADHAAELLAQRLELDKQLSTALAIQDVVIHGVADLGRLAGGMTDLDKLERHARLTKAPEAQAINQSLERLDPALGLSQIYVLDKRGWCVASSKWRDPNVCVGANYTFRTYFSMALATGESQQFAVGKQVRVPSMFYGGRIGAAEEPLGVLVVRTTAEGLEKLLPRTGALTLIVDKLGMVMASSQPGHLLKHVPGYPRPSEDQLATTYGGSPFEQIPLQPVAASDDRHWRLQGQNLLSATSRLLDNHFSVIHFADASELGRQHAERWRTAAAFILLGLLAILAIERTLNNHQYLVFTADQLKKSNTSLQDLANRLHEMAITDELTGVANRRALMDHLENEIERARRTRRPFTLMMLDIDHFKRINDTHGHAVGDQAIVALVGYCRAAMRTYDFMGRIGGEEFVVLLPESNLANATTIAERLRNICEREEILLDDGEKLQFTVSIGLAQLAADETRDALLERADEQLYRAKSAGRNRVCGQAAEQHDETAPG